MEDQYLEEIFRKMEKEYISDLFLEKLKNYALKYKGIYFLLESWYHEFNSFEREKQLHFLRKQIQCLEENDRIGRGDSSSVV